MITVKDLKEPEARRPFLAEYLKLPREDSLDARTIVLDLYSSRTGRPACYVVNNLDLLAPNGKPDVPEVWSALENCEINFSHTPGGLPREQQLEWLRLVTEEKMWQQTAMRQCWAEFQDEDGDETTEAEGEELGSLHRDARRELPEFLGPDDYRKATEFNWHMLGHPDYPLPDIRIDRLPRAEVVIRVGIAVSTAFVLRVILQNGKDINGFDIRDDHTLDHIDPACEGNELTFGNMHPMIRGFNSRKNDRPLADYLDGEVEAARMTSRRRNALVELDEARKKNPTGFMDWWLLQHQNAYDNANGGDGKSNDTQHPEQTRDG